MYNNGQSTLNSNISDTLIYLLFIFYIGVVPLNSILLSYDLLPHIPMTLLLLVGLTTYYFIRLTAISQIKIKINMNLISIITLLWIILIQLVSYPWAVKYSDMGSNIYFDIFGKTAIASLLMWFAGVNIDKIYISFNRRKLKYFTYIVYSSFIATIIYSIVTKPVRLTFGTFFIYNVRKQLDYLFISDTLAIFTLFIIGSTRKKIIKILFSIVGIVFLYATLSRTSFFLYVALLLANICNAITRKSKLAVILIVFLLIFSVLVVKLIIQFTFTMDNLPYSRMLELIVNKTKDDSYVARKAIFQQGMLDIKENWLLGLFMKEVERTGGKGDYIHNWLSYLVAYGIIPFVLITVLITCSLIRIIRLYLTSNNILINLVFNLSVFIIISTLFSRSYIYPFIWFAIAACNKVNDASPHYIT